MQTVTDVHFSLPPLPAVANRVLESIRTGKATATVVADLLAADAALVAELLKLVNSAYYGLPREIGNVRHAVAYLGLAEIERIVLTASVMRQFSTIDRTALEHFWFHAFHTALTAKLLVRRTQSVVDPEELQVAALLHDVGKLVYLQFEPDAYRPVIEKATREGRPEIEVEHELGLPTHCRVGAELAGHWRLPSMVISVCENHEAEHLELLAPDTENAETIRLASVANLAVNLAGDDVAEERREVTARLICRHLDYDDESFLLLMGEIYELRGDVEEFLSRL